MPGPEHLKWAMIILLPIGMVMVGICGYLMGKFDRDL
jgi:hypothetical protein